MSDTQCRCSRSDRARSSHGYIRVMEYSSCDALAVHLVMMLPLDCYAVHIKAHERLTALRLRCMRFLLSFAVNTPHSTTCEYERATALVSHGMRYE